MTYDDHDIHSAALCAWKEARGEGHEGVVAVLWVLRNRVGASGFASNLHDVIYGKNQFTSMSVPRDPEFNLEPKAEDELFPRVLSDAASILNSTGPTSDDVTCGARYYANLHNIDKGGWFERNIVLQSNKHPITAQIKRHTFFA